jgi:hypothetical protein
MTSEEEVVLGAAWTVLQAFELNQHGEHRFYKDDARESTLTYLRTGGEERPLNVFGLQVSESVWGSAGQHDLLVDNRNARGDETYRGMLREAILAVGIEEPQA